MKETPGPSTPEQAATPRSSAAKAGVKRAAGKSEAAQPVVGKQATRPAAKATPRVGVTQADFTPPADVPEPVAEITPAKRTAKATPAKAPAPAARKAAKKAAAPAKRAAKAAAAPAAEPEIPVEAVAAPTTETVTIIESVEIDLARTEAETPTTEHPETTNEGTVETIEIDRVPAESETTATAIIVPKQAEQAEQAEPADVVAESATVTKVFVGDVLAAGRTRADLPSDAALAQAVTSQPLLTPAALALASVARFGESAREQAEWLRSVYPKVGPERLARVALDSARKRARYAVGATLLGWPLGAAASVSTLAITKARLIIDVAAIFGADPLDPERAIDILVLLEAYADRAAAAKAVTELVGESVDGSTVTLGDVVMPRPALVAAAATQLLTKAVARLVPGAGALAQALRSATETEQLTGKAIRYFTK